MKELIGWKVFYDNGREFSSKNFSWKDVPTDGILAVIEFYNDGTKKLHHSREYYILDDGKAFGTNNIHPYLAKLGTVKYGRWSKDSLFAEILNKAQESSL